MEDWNNPFADLRSDTTLQIGSYGIHIDVQHNALSKIVKAKAYAKAVKSDDATVPVHLWNKRVRTLGISETRREKALNVLQKLGHSWFVKRLLQSCLGYVHAIHGCAWTKSQRARNGRLTEFGKDHEAIAGILWHSVHTSWFEFHAGSRLIFCCFPK